MDKHTTQPYLLDRLKAHAASDSIPMHMPGHKRNIALLGTDLPYNIDITEIEGFDNLHGASGILNEYMEEIAVFYGTKRSYYLVNGSTCGILAGNPRCDETWGQNCGRTELPQICLSCDRTFRIGGCLSDAGIG